MSEILDIARQGPQIPEFMLKYAERDCTDRDTGTIIGTMTGISFDSLYVEIIIDSVGYPSKSQIEAAVSRLKLSFTLGYNRAVRVRWIEPPSTKLDSLEVVKKPVKKAKNKRSKT